MYKQLLSILVVFTTMVINGFAQQILVMDADDNQPISEAQVVVYKGVRQTLVTSNSVGIASSPALKSFDSVSISRLGYIPLTIIYH